MVKVVGGRVLSQVQDMRKALDKAIKGTDSAETVMDILTAIEILPMTPDLIKESKLGKILISARTKFAAETSVQATEVSNKARDILIGWKKIMEDHMKKEKDEKEEITEKTDKAEKTEKTGNIDKPEITQMTEKKSTSPEGPVKSKVSETTLKISLLPSGLSRVERIRAEMGGFPEARRKVIALLTGYLKLSTASSNADGGDSAEITAYTVDKAVDGLHSFDLDNKAYMGLVRSLAFNLKRNESLRCDLLTGALTPQLLVTLTPEDLATDELRKRRQDISVADRESRRTDWLEEHKKKIQEDSGIDPANVWEYDEEVVSDAE